MDDDWKEWERLENIRSMQPPLWLIHDTYVQSGMVGAAQTRDEEKPPKRRKKVLLEQWNGFLKILHPNGQTGAGYERLLSLKTNMEERDSEFKTPIEKWGARVDYWWQVREKYSYQLHTRSEESEYERGIRQEYPQLADERITETILDFDDDGRLSEWPDLDRDWFTDVDKNQGRPWTRESISIRFRPSTHTLRQWGIPIEHVEAESPPLGIDPSMTWREALHLIDDEIQNAEQERRRYRRSAEFLDFRLRLLGNVIHQFETFGSVNQMTEEDAQSLIDRDLPDLFSGRTTLRDHAERLVKKYRQSPSSLPDGMEVFKEWVPDGEDATGRSIVVQLTRAFREEEVSDRYDDPESFCDLVKRLLEKHFDERSETF